MAVCDNINDHMVGHVYLRFNDEEDAADCIETLKGRFYDGKVLDAEFSPVTDFKEARCRQFDEDCCTRGGFCNFMHIKKTPHEFKRSLYDDAVEVRREVKKAKAVEKERKAAEKAAAKAKRKAEGGESGGRDRSDSSGSDSSGNSRSRSYSRSRSRSPP